MRHNDLITNSSCRGHLYHLRNGLFENVGWSVWRCQTCGTEVNEYPKTSGISNKETIGHSGGFTAPPGPPHPTGHQAPEGSGDD
jgi:hypothetical protein